MKKKILCAIIFVSSFLISYSQEQIQIDTDSLVLKKEISLQNNKSLELIFSGSRENIQKYFFNTKIRKESGEDSLFTILKITKPALTKQSIESDIKPSANGKNNLKIELTSSIYGPDNFSLFFSSNGTSPAEIKVKLIEPTAEADSPEKAPSNLIITENMMALINGTGGCQPCELYSQPQEIASKNERKHSTDYIVIYDPALKKDAYTICKHVFEKKDGKLYERFVKVSPKWFAPSVGSQIRFEVINQPLTSTLKLVVDEMDVFNGGASQFSSIISSLVNANIINPVSATTTTSQDQEQVLGNTIPDDLDDAASEILRYMTSFKISSCAIQQHWINLPIIIENINNRFKTTAANADQLAGQLSNLIEKEISETDIKDKALKSAELIVNALKSLETVKPIAYTTLRAKNRDYIEIKYSDGNNVLSKPENIRMAGGMKIDFSGGFVLTGLKDYSYALKDITVQYTPEGSTVLRDTTGNVIVQEDEGNNQVGVGILTHFYPRLSSHYNIGGTVGLMTSTNLNLRLMLGGSVMFSSLFGSNNRVSFSGGVVWGKVKRLSVQHQDYFNQPRAINELPNFYNQASAPTPIDRNEQSWFFAITMNFGGN
jgi:hypothetical protein